MLAPSVPPKNVLIVDDTTFIRAWLVQLLNGLPSIGQIYEAGSYQQAKAIFQNNPIHIIILDINLPDVSGIELLRYVKARVPDVIIVMLTNQSDEFYRARCKVLGADHFVDKSCEFDKVSEIVKSLL